MKTIQVTEITYYVPRGSCVETIYHGVSTPSKPKRKERNIAVDKIVSFGPSSLDCGKEAIPTVEIKLVGKETVHITETMKQFRALLAKA